MIFSLFLWFVGALATISQQPELLVEVLVHFVSVMPQYVTFAAPRMWSRFSHHMQYTREDTPNSTALPPHVSVLPPRRFLAGTQPGLPSLSSGGLGGVGFIRACGAYPHTGELLDLQPAIGPAPARKTSQWVIAG